MRCRGLQVFANSVFLRGFLFPVLPTIAGYCVRVRVKLGSSTLDSYSHWMPSIARNTAEEMDEVLG
jgi:hypothetical protein